MDPLTHFLDGPRAARAFALAVQMSAPWGITVRDKAALTVLAVTQGEACVDGVLLGKGDVVLVRGPEPYEVTDAAGSVPTFDIGPGQLCTTDDGHDVRDQLRHGIRRWGNAEDGETSFLVGTYERPDQAGGIVARSLPRLAVVRRENADSTLVELLARELTHDGPAAQVVVDRLLDVLVVSTIRTWFDNPGSSAGSAWMACDDPVVISALERLHAEPEAHWTVENLARSVNISRASLAARFRAAVGEPPMAYLTRWRLTLAGDLLQGPNTITISQIAHAVGYTNAYSFSTAFKRCLGTTPTEFRHRKPVLSDGMPGEL